MDDCTYSMYLKKSLLHKIVVPFCLSKLKYSTIITTYYAVKSFMELKAYIISF